jgi:hypothetical protein
VLGLGVGAVTGAVSLSQASSIKSQCNGNACPSNLKDEHDRAVVLGNVSTATFVIGGAALATGGVLLYLSRPQRKGPEPRAGVQARVGLGRVDVEGSF